MIGKLHDVLAAYGGNQFLRSSQRNDLSVVHNRHAVAQPLGLIHIVRGQDDGATGLLQAIDQVPQVTPRLRIKPRCRLVEKQQLRIADQRAGHRQPLLLASRESAHA